MNLRPVTLFALLALVLLPAAPAAAKGELIFGCWTRPACGKVCKLVCETTTLTSTCYGVKCEQTCIPGRSYPGCKHCAACCGKCEPGLICLPKCLFCWRDWCPTTCGVPISVKKLTKYQAEREVRSYHWEVVDACRCGCGCECGDECSPGGRPDCGCGCVYKPAPEGANIGDSLDLTEDERAQVAAWITAHASPTAVQPASATDDGKDVAAIASAEAAVDQPAQPLWQRLGAMFGHTSEQ